MSEHRRPDRPCRLDPEIVERILGGLIDGQSLRALCESKGMPSPSTVFRWLQNDADFRRSYALARAIQAELMAEEILEIADGLDGEDHESPAAVNRAKLRLDARKWYLARLRPRVYGTADELGALFFEETTGEPRQLGDVERVQRLLALLNAARAGKRSGPT